MKHFAYPGATSTICGERLASIFIVARGEHDVTCPRCQDALASR